MDFSVVELDGKLDEARVVARRGDAAKVSGIQNLTGKGIKTSGGGDCVEVADWIGEIDVVKQVEHFGAKLDVLRFVDVEAPGERNIDVVLSGTA